MEIKGFKETIDWYDQNAKNYADATDIALPTDLLDHFITLLPAHPKVLDAGCGAGRDTALLTEKGAKTTGLDISEGLLAEAKKRHPELTFVYGSFLEIPFDDKIFDGVWAHAALVHLETIADVKKSLQEFYQVLLENGVAHISVKEQLDEEKTAIVKDKLSNHNRFFRYYTEKEMRNYLDEAKFLIIDFTRHPDSLGRTEVSWLNFFVRKF